MWGPIITILRTQPILIYYLKGLQSFGPPTLHVPPPLVYIIHTDLLHILCKTHQSSNTNMLFNFLIGLLL